MRQSRKAKITALSACSVIAGSFCLALLAAPSAKAAAMEQVCTFAGSAAPVAEEKFAEEVQLGGVAGMAVNYTGSGGVPEGTVYAATKPGGNFRIAMFTPKVGGCLEFELSWQVRNEAGSYQRCGPDLEVKCEPGVTASASLDVEVNQGTGNVYALNGEIGTPGRKMVVEYDAEGTEEITRFGEKAAEGKTAETPTQIHGSNQGGLAINLAGEVYVFDKNNSDNEYHRLMVFKPQTPGDFENYVYAGDVAAGFNADGRIPRSPVADAAGNLYVAGEEYVEMYAPEAPAPYPAAAAEVVCSFEHEPGGITAITVNPTSGEVFFFSLKKEAGFKFKLVHQLAPCDEAKGVFEEIGKFEVAPERDDLFGLAFDPEREFSATRPAGTLYAGAPGPVPNSGVGKGEPGQSSLGYGFAPAEEKPPSVLSESITKVGAKSTQLRASINPEGFPTNYVFEYLTEAAYEAGGESFEGAVEAPPGGAPIPGTVGAQPVAVTRSGLLPDTEYRFRVVASSECAPGEPGKECVVNGAGRRFRTYLAGAQVLPDGRGYELVSPAQKNGGQVFPADSSFDSCGPIECKPGHYHHFPFPLQSTPEGDAVAYEGTSFGPSEGAKLENEYIARRSASGWQSTNPTPQLLQPGSGYKAFDPSLGVGVLVQPTPVLSPAAPEETANLYSQPSANPLALTPLVSALPPNRGPGQAFQIVYQGASADLSRVFFSANDALTAATPFAPEPPDPGPDGTQLYEWSGGQLRLVNVLPGNAGVKVGASFGAGGANAISADGSRAFWVDGAGQTYMREDGEETLEIPGGKFLVADTEGSKVLLDDGTLYDLEAKASVDVTEGAGGFEGVVGQSDDLSRIYFVDTAVLTEEENGEGAKAQAGKDNLYAWSAGSPIRFVATLLASDNDSSGNGGGVADWIVLPSQRTAQASPDGRYVAFVSRALLATPIPGYSNVGPCEEDPFTNKFLQVPCPEVFLYDSVSNELTCASCAPSWAEPLGWSALRRLEGAPPSMPQSRYLSNSGRLFFDSQDALSPSDTNGGIEDVYQFEPEGVGGCARDGGCTDLISAGREEVDSNFLASDETGNNVFFTTRDRLLPPDTDELIDLYDARVGGGPPPVSETLPPETPLQPPPVKPIPASPTLSDPGNTGSSKPCKKGQVKKKGKCVKKHKGKKSKGKKSRRGAPR
ncbi:MAG TPA: hypothetical protein VF081_10870 [Solirubrobacterales bacterium]